MDQRLRQYKLKQASDDASAGYDRPGQRLFGHTEHQAEIDGMTFGAGVWLNVPVLVSVGRKPQPA